MLNSNNNDKPIIPLSYPLIVNVNTYYRHEMQLCVCVCVCVCEHSHGRISWSIFTKIGTNVRTPKSKNEFVGGQYRTTPSPILPPKTPILG